MGVKQVSKVHNNAIDAIKAIGILLVVMGHTGSPLFSYIYSFHMGLFFWASGYLQVSRRGRPLKTTVYNAFRRNLIPYVFFWICTVLVEEYLTLRVTGTLFPVDGAKLTGLLLGGGYLSDSSMNFPIWYLQLNFIAVICFAALLKVRNRYLQVLFLGVLVAGTVPFQNMFPGRPAFHINVLPAALVYMYCGAFMAQITPRLKGSVPVGICCLMFGFYFSCGGFISEIGSIRYYLSSLLTIAGIYFIFLNTSGNKVIRYVSGKTLYILGFHSLLTPFAGYFDLFSEALGLENAVIINVLYSVYLVAASCGAAEVYLWGKNKVLKPVVSMVKSRVFSN